MGEVTAPGWLAGSAVAPPCAAGAAGTGAAGADGATGAAAAWAAGAVATAAYFDTFTFRLSCSPYSRLTGGRAARDKSFDVRIAPRKQVKMVLTKAGNFAFYCILHPAMRGTLKVAAQ